MATYGATMSREEMSRVASEVTKSAPLYEQTAHSDAATKRLGDCLDRLIVRLAPVLGPERPALTVEAIKTPAESPHVTWLRQHADSLDVMANTIDYLISRLEV